MKTLSLRRPSGIALVEMIVAVAVMAIAGGILFSAIRTISLLGAKNSAINVTHQQSREMIHKAVAQIHSSVAIPSLANADLSANTGNGPTAGVTYQILVAGPGQVGATANSGQKVVRIVSRPSDSPPLAGMRLIIPAFRLEDDITAVASAGGNPTKYDLTLTNNLPSTITPSSSTNYLTYVTKRSALVVVGNQLRFFENSTKSTFEAVCDNVTTPTPFTIPGGDNRFVSAAFTIRDSRVTGLNLKSMDTTLTLTVPYRARLTTRQ